MIKSVRDVLPITEEQESPAPQMEYLPQAQRPPWAERLTRNLALAGMLLLTVTAVRNAQLPSGQTVLTAVQQIIDTHWDESLGRISFVGGMMPEAVSVFFASPLQAQLVAPCLGEIDHAWRPEEPYLGYTSRDGRLYALAPGQVMSLAHGPEEEIILRIRQADGLETLYYNLAQTSLTAGDQVTAATCLGQLMEGRQGVIQVRREGRPLNPTAWMVEREGT